jgi:hypothetical protein
VFPADEAGHEPRPGHAPGGTAFVYLTDDPEQAAWYARHSKGRGRPKVLTVVPTGEVEHDPSTFDGERDCQYRSRWPAKVVAVRVVPEHEDGEVGAG